MTFPSLPQFLKAVILAVLLGVFGYFLFPIFGLSETTPQTLFMLALAFGAFLGATLMAVKFGMHAIPAESGENVTIFVGNLAFKASQEELQQLFAPYGRVQSVRIMKDRATRRPRGFAFVEMDANHAPRAIKALDGKEFLGRKLRVNEGAERQDR